MIQLDTQILMKCHIMSNKKNHKVWVVGWRSFLHKLMFALWSVPGWWDRLIVPQIWTPQFVASENIILIRTQFMLVVDDGIVGLIGSLTSFHILNQLAKQLSCISKHNKSSVRISAQGLKGLQPACAQARRGLNEIYRLRKGYWDLSTVLVMVDNQLIVYGESLAGMILSHENLIKFTQVH